MILVLKKHVYILLIGKRLEVYTIVILIVAISLCANRIAGFLFFFFMPFNIPLVDSWYWQQLYSIKSPQTLKEWILNHCSEGKHRLKFLPASGYNVFDKKQYITLFISFWVETPYLLYSVDSLALNSRPTGLSLMPEQKLI